MTLDLQLTEHQPIASHFAAVTVSSSSVLWTRTLPLFCKSLLWKRLYFQEKLSETVFHIFSMTPASGKYTQTLLVNCYAIISIFEILTFRDYFNIIALTNRDEITSLASRLHALHCNCADHSQLTHALCFIQWAWPLVCRTKWGCACTHLMYFVLPEGLYLIKNKPSFFLCLWG